MATISDVARQAGVSMMTVSRVINKSGHVSEKTRQRVLEAIRELGYRPNMVAKGLATGHNQLIAYVMSNLANPFFGDVSMGVENACAERGYSVIIYDVVCQERLEECIDMLIDRQIDGVIFHHLDISSDQVMRLSDGGVKCVTIDNELPLDNVTSVDSDNYDGARMATRYLIDKGHTRIGCIHGKIGPRADSDEFIETFQRRIWHDRTNGFLDELKSAGLKPACMLEGRGTMRQGFLSGRDCLIDILDLPNPPTALYCQNDLLALGALGECLERKIAVPEKLAIVGHDGLDMCMFLYPRVTTVMQPRYKIGHTAAEKLLDCIENHPAPERVMTNSNIFVGDTT